MINKDFFKQAEDVAFEKGIDVEEVYQIMEKALINSFKKMYGNTSCRVVFNSEKNEILLFSRHIVVDKMRDENAEEPEEEINIEPMLLSDAHLIKPKAKVGDIIEQPVKFDQFGRLAVSAAKSVYTQNIRSLEREKAFNYFKELEDEMISAQVIEVGEKYITLNLGHGVTTLLPNPELLPNDHLKVGDFTKVYVKKVEPTTKDPKVFVSRSERNLVTRLMESFIPEIKSGIIEIKGIARDPGDRTKIAIYSHDSKVDAIGSCVGEYGNRIKEVVSALNGEKIDLYKWSENVEELIANSLQPSEVTKVLNVNPKEKTSLVVVPDDQLSLAIGKAGQNVRLAVQSCGWKIDIKPTSEAYNEGLLI